MQIEISDTRGITALKLSGEIDLHASPALRAELQKCVRSKVSPLLLDFSSVDYIDSSGLATLIEYIRESAAFQGELALFGLQKKVRTIFDLVRLNELFVISGTADEAIAALAAK
ncbi:MAG: STAS domain-containing protein [Terrimicrobiaceae bacterium]